MYRTYLSYGLYRTHLTPGTIRISPHRVEWTAASVSLSQTKSNDINLNDRNQMQNDTENEIGRSLFPLIYNSNIRLHVINRNLLQLVSRE